MPIINSDILNADTEMIGEGIAGAGEGTQVYPVFKAAPGSNQQNNHNVIAWKVVQDLQMRVAKYGLGSQEFMQIIRVINTDLLAPFDVKHLAQVLFQPVEFGVFESNWSQMAERAAKENMHRPQDDPTYTVGCDALMGRSVFSNPDTS